MNTLVLEGDKLIAVPYLCFSLMIVPYLARILWSWLTSKHLHEDIRSDVLLVILGAGLTGASSYLILFFPMQQLTNGGQALIYGAPIPFMLFWIASFLEEHVFHMTGRSYVPTAWFFSIGGYFALFFSVLTFTS